MNDPADFKPNPGMEAFVNSNIRSEVIDGATHPKYFERLSDLALLYQKTQRIPEAASLYTQSGIGNRRLLEKSAGYSAESEQFVYLKTFQRFTAQSYSFAQDFHWRV